MSLRVLIVDDEELARRGLRVQLERASGIEVVGESANGRQAVAAVQSLRPELVLLDVQMPGMTGFDVVREVGCSEFPAVIFVTAYDRYALEAFAVNAVDYLLKPVDDERLGVALAKVRNATEQRRASELGGRLEAMLHALERSRVPLAGEYAERFAVRSAGRVLLVPVGEIDWCEAAGDYVRLHLGSRSCLVRDTMAAVERSLDPRQFVRIHRSTIVNLSRVRELRSHDNGEYVVLLRDGTELKLSRTFRPAVERIVAGRW